MTTTHVKLAGFIVVTDKTKDGHFIAYRVNEHGAVDFDHIGFGHGETRDAAIIDLYKKTK